MTGLTPTPPVFVLDSAREPTPELQPLEFPARGTSGLGVIPVMLIVGIVPFGTERFGMDPGFAVGGRAELLLAVTTVVLVMEEQAVDDTVIVIVLDPPNPLNGIVRLPVVFGLV